MNDHNHTKEHELLFLHCAVCNSNAMEVRIIEGAIFFDCAVCHTECGVMEDIQEDTKALLAKGCSAH